MDDGRPIPSMRLIDPCRLPSTLSPEQVDDIHRRWQGRIDWVQIDFIAERYHFYIRSHPVPPSETQALVNETKELVAKLRRRLGAIQATSDRRLAVAIHMSERFPADKQGTVTLKQASLELVRLERLLTNAKEYIIDDGPKSADRVLIQQLASTVRHAGFKANRSKSSPLVDLVDIVLQTLPPELQRGRNTSAESMVEYRLKENSLAK